LLGSLLNWLEASADQATFSTYIPASLTMSTLFEVENINSYFFLPSINKSANQSFLTPSIDSIGPTFQIEFGAQCSLTDPF